MPSKLLVALIVVAPDGRLFQGPVHPLDLAVRPGMLRLCQAVADTILGTGQFESVSAEALASIQSEPDVWRG